MTDDVRRSMIETGQPAADLATEPGEAPVWTTEALQADFQVVGFAAPFVVVRRRTDGVRGSLEFTHDPRVYFGWCPE
jgi:hypothetical protein